MGVAEGDDVSCADKVEIAQLENQTAQKNESRVVMRRLPSRCITVGQALRQPFLEEGPALVCAARNRCKVVSLLTFYDSTSVGGENWAGVRRGE